MSSLLPGWSLLPEQHVLASTALDLAGCEPPIPQLPEAVVDEILLYVPNCLSTCAPVCKVWAAAAVRATTRRKQEQETLLAALASRMGFHKGKPLAALVVFRACLLWRVFQADRTKVFDGIAQVIGTQIKQDDTACLAYWLTITVTLLHLLQRNIKPASGSNRNANLVAAAARLSIIESLFGRQPGAGEASIHGGGVGGFRLVEAKYPALLFKQQLDAFLKKIFPLMRDNVKKNIKPLLGQCINNPRGPHNRIRPVAPSRRLSAAVVDAALTASPQNKAWSDILLMFDDLLITLKDNHVPKPLVQALFKQLFSFVNVQLFNQLLLRRECLSFSNGEHVKTGLAQVESWIMEYGTDWVGESWDELKHLRQAVTFLLVGDKSKKTFENIAKDMCPVLSIQQLYRISTMYWDDNYNTETVSTEVLGHMKQTMVANSSRLTHSFLLDDDSTLPFVANEILAQMDDMEGVGDHWMLHDKDFYALPVPKALRSGDNAGSFAFLEKKLHLSQM